MGGFAAVGASGACPDRLVSFRVKVDPGVEVFSAASIQSVSWRGWRVSRSRSRQTNAFNCPVS